MSPRPSSYISTLGWPKPGSPPAHFSKISVIQTFEIMSSMQFLLLSLCWTKCSPYILYTGLWYIQRDGRVNLTNSLFTHFTSINFFKMIIQVDSLLSRGAERGVCLAGMRIRHFFSMDPDSAQLEKKIRIRIRRAKNQRIRLDPDPHPWVQCKVAWWSVISYKQTYAKQGQVVHRGEAINRLGKRETKNRKKGYYDNLWLAE